MTAPKTTWQQPSKGISTAGDGKIKLTNKTTKEVVDFQYSPVSLTITQTAKVESKGALANSIEQQVTRLEDFNITLSDLRLEGTQEIAKLDILYKWLQPMPSAKIGTHRAPTPPAPPPKPSASPTPPAAPTPAPAPAAPAGAGPAPASAVPADDAAKGSNVVRDPQIIVYSWGKTSYDTVLKSVTTTYTRFNQAGDAIRAKVTLALTKCNLPLPKTNPSSGGEPGGRVHLVTDGDTLQRIAQKNYRDPGAWRDIAFANDIDDPLRVRNGSNLFLPGAVLD